MTGLIRELAASLDPVALMQRIAEQLCVLVPAADGSSVGLLDREDRIVVVATDGVLGPSRGRVVPRGQTFLGYALRSEQVESADDVMTDPRISAEMRSWAVRMDVHSVLSIPLFRGPDAIGAMSVAARAPSAFSDDDVVTIASVCEFVSGMISSNTELARMVHDLLDGSARPGTGPAARFLASIVAPELAERDRLRNEIDALTGPDSLHAVFQPIVDLSDGHVHGVEGLCRFPADLPRTTEDWFRTAHRLGCGPELELRALRTVLDAADELPPDLPVGVNLSPAVALEPAVQEVLLRTDRALVLELTEHEPAPGPLNEGLEPLRRHGIRLAVDDAGAGFAGLTQILRLRPDVLKLDQEISKGIESDAVRRALVTAFVRFAEQIPAVAVAEGIETGEQCAALRALGIRYGQGYWLGRPSPLPLVPPQRDRVLGSGAQPEEPQGSMLIRPP